MAWRGILASCLIVIALSTTSAFAASPAKIEVQDREGYTRLIIATSQQTPFAAAIAGDVFTVEFGDGAYPDLAERILQSSDLFIDLAPGEAADEIALRLAADVRLHASQSMNVIAFDFVAPDFRGDPPDIISWRELARDRAEDFFSNRSPSLKRPRALRAAPAFSLSVLQLAEDVREAVADERTADARMTAFEMWRARALADGFTSVEQSLQSDAAFGGVAAHERLAGFYYAHGLMAEAVAVIENIAAAKRAEHVRLLHAAAAINMGRWNDVLAILDGSAMKADGDVAAFRAIALSELGAFETARREFDMAEQISAPYEDIVPCYFLSEAAARMANGEADAAQAALDSLRGQALTAQQRWSRRFNEALLQRLRGNDGAATEALTRLAGAAPAPISLRAQLILLRDQASAGDMRAVDALAETARLRLQFSGGTFERDAIVASAAYKDETGDAIGAIEDRTSLITAFPSSDAARKAEAKIRSALALILDDPSISPSDAARVFYENIDLAPPGAEGDALIRNAARTLTRLDLLLEASELLRHQAFERLRGVEKSYAGADLAELYLSLDDSARAINALMETRRSRLPMTLEARRAVLAARAHFAAGETEAALGLLAAPTDKAAFFLKGDILAQLERYAEAGDAYVDGLRLETAPLTEDETQIALKAAAVYISADAREASRRLSKIVGDRIADENAVEILKLLEAPAHEIDRDAFLRAYQDFFIAASDSS
ncbi:MAG: hypothetical protein AAFW81_03770 [Pseudomonadota bacterium]